MHGPDMVKVMWVIANVTRASCGTKKTNKCRFGPCLAEMWLCLGIHTHLGLLPSDTPKRCPKSTDVIHRFSMECFWSLFFPILHKSMLQTALRGQLEHAHLSSVTVSSFRLTVLAYVNQLLIPLCCVFVLQVCHSWVVKGMCHVKNCYWQAILYRWGHQLYCLKMSSCLSIWLKEK